MRFVVIQGVVIHTEAIDMIVPHDKGSTVSFRGGSERVFEVTPEELMEHLRHEDDDLVRVAKESGKPEESLPPSNFIE